MSFVGFLMENSSICKGNQKRRLVWVSATYFPVPSADRVLQTGQARRTWFELFLVLDQPLHCRPVAAHLAEQVIEQGRLPQRAREQLLGGMRLPAQLPHHGFNRQREFALGLELRAFLFRSRSVRPDIPRNWDTSPDRGKCTRRNCHIRLHRLREEGQCWWA